MNFKQKLQLYFPNLTILTYKKHKIWFGSVKTAYLIYTLTGFDKPETYFRIYKCRTFYIVDWRGLKDSIVVKFKDSDKILFILNEFIKNQALSE